MAPVDFTHASEEEIGLCSLFQSPFPVSSSAVTIEDVADISGR